MVTNSSSLIKSTMRKSPSDFQYYDDWFSKRHLGRLRRNSALLTRNNGTTLVNSLPQDFGVSVAEKGWRKSIGLYLKNYCEVSTLHGFRYLSETERPLFERCLWVLVILLVVSGMLTLITTQTKTYLSRPLLMSLNGNTTPAWDIPFPAITLCPENQIPLSLINITEIKMASERGKLTELERVKLEMASFLCTDSNSNHSLTSQMDFTFSLKPLHLQLVSTFMCQKNVKSLTWRTEVKENVCSNMQLTVVDNKYCHTFNMLPSDGLLDTKFLEKVELEKSHSITQLYPYQFTPSAERTSWSPETGFQNVSEGVLLRLPGGTLSNSADFLLDFGVDDVQEDCMPRSGGFMVIVHNPVEYPSVYHASVYAEVDKLTTLQIIPQLVQTEHNLRAWKPDERGCYFSGEHPLKFYAMYTSLNCDKECEAYITLQLCGCNLLSQPHYPSSPLCGPDKQECVLESKRKSASVDLRHEFSPCHCLPACNELTFNLEAMIEPRNWTYNTEMYHIPPNETKMNSYVNVVGYYPSRKVNTIVRVGTMSLSDYIANVGGIMGLFIGFSFVSIFEIFYFISIRWITDVIKFRKRSKKSNDVDQKNTNTPDLIHHRVYPTKFSSRGHPIVPAFGYL